MKTHLLILLLCFTLSQCSKKKSSISESTPIESPSDSSPPSLDSSTSPPAILAIQIINPNDTTTEERNSTSKRTIESSLGYGYQANYYPTSQGKKYMVYPYSQKNIPPAPVREYEQGTTLNVQKSIQYNLGTKVEGDTASKGGYYPSTLYSTIGQGGTIGGLSSSIPQQQHVQAATAIPVIILRIYTNQLSDQGAIYPNLPQSHPYANLNNVNLQSIISNYLQQQAYQAQQQYKQPAQAVQTVYPNTVYYPTYYQQQDSAATLPTHENYPSDSHTRVIYHGPKGHIKPNQYQQYQQQYLQQLHQQQQQQEQQSQPQYVQPQPQYAQPQQYVQQQQQQPAYQYSQQQYTTQYQQQPSQNQYQNVYTDSNGEKYIYVDANQLQGQDYQQYYQQDYSQEQPEIQQEYQYQKPQEDRRYLPTVQPEKLYNYHAESTKDRSKKSSGSPITFESKKNGTNSKRKV